MNYQVYPFLHPAWGIYATAPAQVRHILDRKPMHLGSGAFSEVYAVDDSTVLKLSTCRASRIILPRLLGRPTPGLPQVYKAFGQVGRVAAVAGDYAALPIHAYLVERLWSLDAFKDQALSEDDCPRGELMRARTVSDALDAFRWLASRLADGKAREAEQCEVSSGLAEHPLVTALYEELAPTRFRQLVGLMRRFSPRVLSGEWTFDWIRRFEYNVMLSRWGEPILADPVYDLNQPLWKEPYYSDSYSY